MDRDAAGGGDTEADNLTANVQHGDHDFVAALACGACGERVAAADIEPRGPAVAPR